MDRCWGKSKISLGRPVKLMPLMRVQFPLMGWIVGKDSPFFREIIKIKGRVQQGNTAVMLVQKFYSVSELINRNCRVTRGKEPLESTKLAIVRECIFKPFFRLHRLLRKNSG